MNSFPCPLCPDSKDVNERKGNEYPAAMNVKEVTNICLDMLDMFTYVGHVYNPPCGSMSGQGCLVSRHGVKGGFHEIFHIPAKLT